MSTGGRKAGHGFAGLFCRESSSVGKRLKNGWSRLASDGFVRPVSVGPVTVAGPTPSVQRMANGLFVLSGRIDNIDDLHRDCGGDSPASPQALPVQALRRWGRDALARFRGAFSFAFWDGAEGRLVLASDPLGLRSVFYTRIDDAVAFSTSLRDLLALPDASRELNDDYLAAFLSDVVPEPDATLYAAITRVPAACTAAFDRDGTVSVQEYWRPNWDRRIRYDRDETYVEEARALLDQAVRRQVHGPGPVVCQLSGGFDSGAVAATAARLRSPATVHALTMAPAGNATWCDHPSSFGDERELAAASARMHPNMAWEAVSSSRLHPLDENPLRLFLALSMPARNVMNIGWFAPLFDRARVLGATAVLTGNFGNMTLSWAGKSGMASWARRGHWRRLGREAAAMARLTGDSTARVLLRNAVRPLFPPRVQRWLDERRGKPAPQTECFSAIHPDFARSTKIAERRLDKGHDYPGCTAALRRNWLSRIQTLPPWLDPMSDVFGVEMRDPTADLDLLEFCFAVPDEQYLRNGQTRWLARRVLADRLPPEVLAESRRGRQCPEFFYRMTLQRDRIAEGVMTLEGSPLASRVLDVERMKRLLADWPADGATATFHDYGAVLSRGLHFGQFLRWIEGGNQ